MHLSTVEFTQSERQYIESVTAGDRAWWNQNRVPQRPEQAQAIRVVFHQATQATNVDWTQLADQLASIN